MNIPHPTRRSAATNARRPRPRALTAALSCLCLTAALSAEPRLFWSSDPVQPDDTVVVAGSGFGESPVVRLVVLKPGVSGRPLAQPEWPAWGQAIQPPVLQASDESLKFVIPETLEPSAWVFRVESARGGVSRPKRLNCPTVYWTQGDRGLRAASPGGRLWIFGRSVGAPPLEGRISLRRIQDGREVSLQPDKASVWRLAATVPADLPHGAWQMFVHNGRGGEHGWAPAGELDVAPAEPWPAKVFNVRDFGATGMGTVEDGLGIDQALAAAAEAGGGVLYFPRGRYRMDHTLSLPRYTVLRGESRELVSIFWPDTKDPYVLVQGTDHFGVEDLTLYASNYTHAIAGETHKPECGHTFLRRVRVRADIYRGHLTPEDVDARFRAARRLSTGCGDTVRLGGPNVEVTDCDLYGSGRAIYLYKPRGARVVNNRFYNGRWGWYCLTGCDGLVFEGNTLTGADLMSTGGGINCLGATYSQNVYYAGNTVALCHGWDREAMTTDAGHGAYYGRVSPAGPARIVLAGEPTWRGRERWQGGGVFVLGGRGMGQYRQIAEVAEDERTVTVDRPWDVAPDDTSIVTITMMQQNYLFIDNHFEDAGIALQYYGTSINHVAAGNTSTRAGGFYNSGRWYRHYQPSWYCQFLGNQILEGNGYRFGPNNATGAGDSFLGTYGLQRGDNPAPLAYCSVHRRNHLHNNAVIRLRGVSRERPGVRDAVVEHNVVENANTGLYVDDGCVGVVVRKNKFVNVDRERFDPAEERRRLMAKRAQVLDRAEAVYHQTFERRAGRLFPDASGNRFTAIETAGQVTLEPGLSGQAGRFDGAGYLVVNDRQMLRFPRLTVAAWVLPDMSKGRWGVVAKRTRGSACPYVMAIRDGRVTFEGTDTAGKWSYNHMSGSALKPNAWNHVAVSCEEGKLVRIYCNGVQVAEKQVTGQLVETTQALTIGFEAWGGHPANAKNSGNFRGLIDEVKVWSRILTRDEIAAEFSQLEAAAAKDSTRRGEEAQRRAEALKQTGKDLVAHGGVIWKPVVMTTFDGPALDAYWVTLRGSWQLQGGSLRCSETSFLGFSKPVRAPVRIEFDARSKRPGDLTGFWGTKDAAYKAGYFIGFASNGKTANKILKRGQQVAQSGRPLAVPGRWHHVIAQVLPGRVQLVVDGQVALEYKDPAPVTDADMAGIIAWSEAEFDNLRIFHGE